MKKSVFALIIALALVSCLCFVQANVFINEIMYNPDQADDTDAEWIELYNNGTSDVDLCGWTVDDELFDCTNISSGTWIIVARELIDGTDTDTNSFESIWGNNDDAWNSSDGSYSAVDGVLSLINGASSIVLKNSTGAIIYNATYSTSIGANGNNKSLQYCNGSLREAPSTPGVANNCTIPAATCNQNYSCGSWSSCSGGYQTRTCTNYTSNCTNFTITENQSCSISDPDIYIELDWNEDDIVNGDTFEITFDAYYLDDKDYDIKIWIQNDDDDVISERYDEEEDEWKSGTYFIENVFTSDGNESQDIKIRIDSDYESFDGDAKIYGRIRENGEDDPLDCEFEEDIEVIEAEEDSGSGGSSNSQSQNTNTNTASSSTNRTTNSTANSGIISLGSGTNSTNSNSNSIIYKSKIEYIKDYAPYALAFLCIGIMTFFLIDWKKMRLK